ncbi:MAG: hypothetical protein ACOYKZ_04020 [Chlamydiia bacterium]
MTSSSIAPPPLVAAAPAALSNASSSGEAHASPATGVAQRILKKAPPPPMCCGCFRSWSELPTGTAMGTAAASSLYALVTGSWIFAGIAAAGLGCLFFTYNAVRDQGIFKNQVDTLREMMADQSQLLDELEQSVATLVTEEALMSRTTEHIGEQAQFLDETARHLDPLIRDAGTTTDKLRKSVDVLKQIHGENSAAKAGLEEQLKAVSQEMETFKDVHQKQHRDLAALQASMGKREVGEKALRIQLQETAAEVQLLIATLLMHPEQDGHGTLAAVRAPTSTNMGPSVGTSSQPAPAPNLLAALQSFQNRLEHSWEDLMHSDTKAQAVETLIHDTEVVIGNTELAMQNAEEAIRQIAGLLGNTHIEIGEL